MEKETNKSKIIFITALVCIALCIPIGIILGRTLLGKNESNKTNNNVVNNTNENTSGNILTNEILNCTKDNYKTCLPNIEERSNYEMIYISSDADSISEIQHFIADNLSYNITILLDNDVKLKKSNKSYYTWDVISNEKNIGVVNSVLNYYKNDNYIIFLSTSISTTGGSLINDKDLFVYDIQNNNTDIGKVNSIAMIDNKLNVIIKTINLENNIDKDKLCSDDSMYNDKFGYKYFINLLTKEKSSNETILVKDFCTK